MRAIALLVGPVGWMTLIASARSVARPSESIAIARRFAPVGDVAVACSSVRPSGLSPAGRADVFNLSVEGAEEYFANGLLVHNCVYDLIAHETVPSAVPSFAAAVGGTRTDLVQPAPSDSRRQPAARLGGLSRRQLVRSAISSAASADLQRSYGNPDGPLRRGRRRELVI